MSGKQIKLIAVTLAALFLFSLAWIVTSFTRKPAATQTIAGIPVNSSQPGAPAGAEDDPEHAIPYLYQALPEGATPADQPQAYTSMSVTFSAGGRYAAFYARTDYAIPNPRMAVIVRDLQTKTDTIIPAPNEKIFKSRNIKFLVWDRNEPRLYILEEASPHAREIETFLAHLSEPHDVNRLKEIAGTVYNVLYAWKPGASDVQILDTFHARILSISAGNDGPCIAHLSPEKGPRFVDLRRYQNDRPLETQTVAIRYPDELQRQTLGRFGVKILARHNELWFTTRREDTKENWLVMVDLDNPEQDANMVLRDVLDFHWSRDEQTLFVSRIRGAYFDNEFEGEIDIARFQRGALDKPTILAARQLSHGGSFDFVGLGPNERSVYLYSLTQPKMRMSDLGADGAMQLYVLPIGNQ